MRNASIALLSLTWLTWGCTAPRAAAPPMEDERGELLELVARGYYPGRSGQILFAPERGDYVLRKPVGYYGFMHGSSWDYDRHIPTMLYGPGFVVAGARSERVHQQDVAPTLLALVGIPPAPTMSGRALDFVFRSHDAPPKVAVAMVLDGMRADYLERYGDVMPTLTRMSEQGASFDDAWVNYVPSVTSAGHTTVGTGADPKVHGVSGNGYYDRVLGREFTLYDGMSPKNMMALGIADLWSFGIGESVILTQGTTPRASVSLAGHGACAPNGRATIMAMFDYRDEGWVTNPDCYVLPDYLEGVSARPVWEAAGGSWRDLEIDNGRVFVMTPLLPGFQMDALLLMLDREQVGRDDIPDLVMVNFKSPDYAGHNFGPDSEEIEEVLGAVDSAIARLLEALEAAAGADGYVVAVTADHGMPSEPDGVEHERRFIGELFASLHDELDPDEKRLFYPFRDTANNQFYVDETRMDELGLELADISTVVESLPFVRYAFTEDEVSAAAAIQH